LPSRRLVELDAFFSIHPKLARYTISKCNRYKPEDDCYPGSIVEPGRNEDKRRFRSEE
jgi:hypothetical protein